VREIEGFEIRDETALQNPARLPRKSRFARNRKKVALLHFAGLVGVFGTALRLNFNKSLRMNKMAMAKKV
jgi:hypothetical protein